jgi:hypothetical protein
LIYHWIIAVIAIALLLCGWVWVQRRANREPCAGLADETACAVGPGCHGCARAAKAAMMEPY